MVWHTYLLQNDYYNKFNISIISQNYFFCEWWWHLKSTLNFQGYNTALLIIVNIVTMLYIRLPKLSHLIAGLYPLTNISFLPPSSHQQSCSILHVCEFSFLFFLIFLNFLRVYLSQSDNICQRARSQILQGITILQLHLCIETEETVRKIAWRCKKKQGEIGSQDSRQDHVLSWGWFWFISKVC